LGEDDLGKICVPKDGYWAWRRWGQRIDGTWVEDILKEKMGQGKNVSLRMNSGRGKCGPHKMIRPWEKMFLGEMGQGEGDP
jgi:hypothetical protein